MDRQMQFLQIWAAACQPLVDALVERIAEAGELAASAEFCAAANAYTEKHPQVSLGDHELEFARDVLLVAYAYVDLMGRFGVFSDDTDD